MPRTAPTGSIQSGANTDSVLWGNGANFYGMITNIDH